MPRQIFVNLPVEDLERSKLFYEAIGARNEPKFTNDQAAMMVFSDTIHVMLLRHEFYSGFTGKPIADARRTSQVMLALSCDSPAEVDRMVESAVAAGGRTDPARKPEQGGLMYDRSFEDPDGHEWEPLWMDPQMAEQGAHPVETATAEQQ